jgi:predicted DNA-binding transcriptional regulator AlpA
MSLITQDYYTADQFALMQDVHVKTVYRWVRKGIAPKNEMLGRMLWFEKKAAHAFTPPAKGRRKNTRKGVPAGTGPANQGDQP